MMMTHRIISPDRRERRAAIVVENCKTDPSSVKRMCALVRSGCSVSNERFHQGLSLEFEHTLSDSLGQAVLQRFCLCLRNAFLFKLITLVERRFMAQANWPSAAGSASMPFSSVRWTSKNSSSKLATSGAMTCRSHLIRTAALFLVSISFMMKNLF